MAYLSKLEPNISLIGEVYDTLDTTSLTSLVDNQWPTAGVRVNFSFLKAGFRSNQLFLLEGITILPSTTSAGCGEPQWLECNAIKRSNKLKNSLFFWQLRKLTERQNLCTQYLKFILFNFSMILLLSYTPSDLLHSSVPDRGTSRHSPGPLHTWQSGGGGREEEVRLGQRDEDRGRGRFITGLI